MATDNIKIVSSVKKKNLSVGSKLAQTQKTEKRGPGDRAGERSCCLNLLSDNG